MGLVGKGIFLKDIVRSLYFDLSLQSCFSWRKRAHHDTDSHVKRTATAYTHVACRNLICDHNLLWSCQNVIVLVWKGLQSCIPSLNTVHTMPFYSNTNEMKALYLLGIPLTLSTHGMHIYTEQKAENRWCTQVVKSGAGTMGLIMTGTSRIKVSSCLTCLRLLHSRTFKDKPLNICLNTSRKPLSF